MYIDASIRNVDLKQKGRLGETQKYKTDLPVRCRIECQLMQEQSATLVYFLLAPKWVDGWFDPLKNMAEYAAMTRKQKDKIIALHRFV
jgi:hypothetical protein